jgi:transglutaminase-like putative cysteine protease
MRHYLKVFFSICLFILIIVHPKIFADGEFTADYDVEYGINTQGVTIVTQQVSLTNNLTNIYPKQYTILYDTDKIQNVLAFSNDKQITPNVNKTSGKTQIQVPLGDQNVGIGKKTKFVLRFEETDIAQKIGTIWEVSIPGISDSKDLGSYSVSLQIPESFGTNSYMTPLPANGTKWTKAQMINGGISAAYGNEQYFDLKLKYYLENTGNDSKLTEVALPPDTAYQKVSIRDINPQPINIVRDTDGNWLARYKLEPNSNITIEVNITVSITMVPRSDFGLEMISQNDYLVSTKYWPATDPTIADLALKYSTPRDIFNYVSTHLSYDYTLVNQNPIRKDALRVLANPKNSVCTDFTDLFIAISRAAGIPARQIVGYAYTTNSKLRPLSLIADVLHAWPEYYDQDKHLWIPVDPTWTNTTGGVNYFDKMDFNHIVFAINGKNDDYPYPAGSYRQSGNKNKILDVQFAQPAYAKHIVGKLENTIKFPRTVIAGIPTYGSVTIRNTTGVGIDDVGIQILSSPANVRINQTIDHIPPFTAHVVPFQFITQSLAENGKGGITVRVNQEVSKSDFIIRPLYLIIGLFIILSCILSVFIWMQIKQKHIKNP